MRKSTKPSPSLSMPSSHCNSRRCGPFPAVSVSSVAATQPASSLSTVPSPSLSIPSSQSNLSDTSAGDEQPASPPVRANR